MGYDLSPRRKDAGPFHFGAFSWLVLVERTMGTLYPMTHDGPRWVCAFGADPRMPAGDGYPRLISNDGFRVTADEARIMARCARNYVSIQQAVRLAMQEAPAEKWAYLLIRQDFVDLFERFAPWAEKSGGFRIW